MQNHIEISKGVEEKKRKEEITFLMLNDDERFKLAVEISEIMLRIQFENNVLPLDENFTLQK